MKLKLLICTILFLGLSATFSGCKKEETTPTPAAPTPTAPATTGGLIVKVKLASSTGFLTGVKVNLATNLSNLDNEVYLNEVTTNSSGQANFGQLNPGNYYYDCGHQIGSDYYYGEGQIQIVAGRNDELTLILQ